LNILKATYGSGDCALDVTERLQRLVKNGHLDCVVSNTLFTDPCPDRIKTLRFVYELPSSNQFCVCESEEHKRVIAPLSGGDRIGILYTNQSVPAKFLYRVLDQLKKAAGDMDILTCPWHPIERNPFPELDWFYHVPDYLTMSLQILKLLYTAQDLGPYEYVFFLEHDVLYPEGYFEIEPFSEDVLSNTNYIGLCEGGFQTGAENMECLHMLTMRLPAAIEHFTSCVHTALLGVPPGFMIEPWDRKRKQRRSSEPVVHINHGNHFSVYHTYFSKKNMLETHPYWGSAASWWD
jgi:hypothetical protein